MKHRLLTSAMAASLCATASHAAITGQWDFNDLSATIGQPINYYDGPGAATEGQTQFGTTDSFGISNIDGASATVMKFGVNDPYMGYAVPHGVPVTEGFNVNQWSLIMDVLFPATSSKNWRALIQTDIFNPPSDDAEFYLDESDRLGISNQYNGSVPANTWVRIAFVADLTGESPKVIKYINGVKVGEHAATLDGRFSLTPDSDVLLFTDGYEGGIYTKPGYINSLQIHDEALSPAYIATLGAPTADGIPTTVQTRPFVQSITPAAGQNASPSGAFQAVIQNGVTSLAPNSIQLTLNNQPATPQITSASDSTTIAFTNPELFAPGSTQTWQLVFSDDAAQPAFQTNTVQIVVANYTNLKLPAPIYFEDFEATPEGSLPTGWTNLSYVDVINPEENLQDLGSASFTRWLVIDSARFQNPFGTYFDPEAGETDYQRVLNYNPIDVINGEVVTSVAQGKIAFANSGYHANSGNEVLYLYTPDFNLSGKTNINLVFNSIWEQNQDSIAGVEYSKDGGQSWNPVVYYLSAEAVVITNNIIDVNATFTTEDNDIARYFDEEGIEHGGTYGAFIGAPITAALTPFISIRADDNSTSSKRVEVFPIPGADNSPAVRFRFFHAGTDSWYFGIDNVGLYSINTVEKPVIAKQPSSSTVIAGDFATFTVEASGTGLSYQWFFEGEALEKGTNATLRIDPVQSGHQGVYFVRVTNEGGSTESTPATLTVNPRASSVTAVFQFDNNLESANGVGSLAFATSETEATTTFNTTDGAFIPHIDGEPATYLDIPPYPAGAHGLLLTTPVKPNGGGDYVNQYTMAWDIFIPSPINWTPLFNTDPTNGNDADFYVDDLGRLGIAALGYSAENTFTPDEWHRVIFTADLLRGRVAYYLDGVQVRNFSGSGLVDGRFALYSDDNEGGDVMLFTEPSGAYTHPLLVSSFMFLDRAITTEEAAALGGPKAAGFSVGPAEDISASISQSGSNVTVSWTGGDGPFQVYKTTDIANPSWQPVGEPTTERSVTDSHAGQAAFYVVKDN